MVTDPVCKMKFPREKAAADYIYQNNTYYFCNAKCKEKFAADPELYLSGNAPAVSCCCSEVFEDDESLIDKKLKKLFWGFGLSGVMTLLIVLLNYIALFPDFFTRQIQFLLATFTVFVPGGFLLRRGAGSLKNFKLNMFTLISMGIASAYFYSVYALFFPDFLPESLIHNNSGKLHFQAAAMITALVILGQYLECRASRRAGRAIRSLAEQLPSIAHRVKKCCGSVESVALQEVLAGDLLQVLPGEKIPVDGILMEGCGTVDESMLTGESIPVDKSVGSKLAAGTLNCNTVLLMKAVQVGKDTLIARIIDLVKTARNTKLPIQKLADKVSAVFVPAVLAVAVLSLLYWGLIAGNWSMAIGNFMAVLLAACPCSLGLAAPLAVTVGVGAGAKNGILIKDPAILENLRKVDTLMLDKTGTLTENTLHVNKIYLAENISKERFCRILFALEQSSIHPVAKAVLAMKEFSEYKDHLPAVEDFTSMTGQGVCGIIDDVKFVLGNIDLMRSEKLDIEKFTAEQHIDLAQVEGSLLILAACGQIWGIAVVCDAIRPEAADITAQLKNRPLDLVIISGDNPTAVKRTAYTLGIEEFYAGLSPQNKLEKVRARQTFGRCVAMAGDGVNDAAALAAADVSIAVSSGADAALENAGVTLLDGGIGKLNNLFKLSDAVNETIRQNLYLAFAYNITLIPLAAGVFYEVIHCQISPAVSSIAMSGSCLLVVANSLKLWKIKF